MFIAHLPAGYLLTRALTRSSLAKTRRGQLPIAGKILFFFGLLGSVFPDLDLLYFYFVDGRQQHHHLYWSHVPIIWVLITITALTILKWLNAQRLAIYVWVFVLNVFLHLLLDSLAGGILWLYPVSMELFQVFVVPATYKWWVANFIWHWTFILDLTITYLALAVYSSQNHGVPLLATSRQAKV